MSRQLDLLSGHKSAGYNEQALSSNDPYQFATIMRTKPCRACGPLIPEGEIPVVYRGNVSSKIMIFGQGPGETESETGIPFTGKSGYYLSTLLKYSGIHPDEDCLLTNVSMCYFGTNEPPDDARRNCRVNYEHLISLVNPRVLISMGLIATSQLMGVDPKDIKLHEVIGKWHKSTTGHDLFAIYHPAFIIRREGRQYEKLTEKHLREFKSVAIQMGINFVGWDWDKERKSLSSYIKRSDKEISEPDTDNAIRISD